IHERKEAALAASTLSAIVDSCGDAIISKNLKSVITSWNRGAEQLYGYSAQEAIGRSMTMLVPSEGLDEAWSIVERVHQGERVERYETIRLKKDGSRVNVSLTLSPVKDADGQVIGASSVARDITERVLQEEALKQANAALQHANGDLQQF